MHPFFRAGWHLEATPFPFDPTEPVQTEEEYEPQALPPLRERGANLVPTIHVDDLGSAVAKLVSVYPPMTDPCVLAVDKSRHSMAQLLGGLSKELGTGEMQNLNDKESSSMKGILQLQLDLRVQPLAIAKLLPKAKHWKCQSGLLSGMAIVLEEFRQERKLTPIQTLVTGPPGSGKSSLAAALAAHYKVNHIDTALVVQEALERQPKKFAKAVKRAGKKNGGRLPDRILVEMFRLVLQTQRCKNQGYILDGFPKAYMQATWLTQGWKEHEPEEDEEEPPAEVDPDYAYGYPIKPLEDGEEEEPEEEEEEEPEPEAAEEEEEDEEAREARLALKLATENKQCTPTQVLNLAADEQTLKKFVMATAQEIVVADHNDETGLDRRIAMYRQNNVHGTDTAHAKLALDLKIPWEVLQAAGCSQQDMLAKAVAVLGVSHNYGPTEEEVRAEREAKEAKEKEAQDKAAAELKEKLAREAEERAVKEKAEADRKNEIRDLDEARLLRAAIPLRKFLQSNVMAVVRRGLIECAEVRPDDPVDYLAQYLLENNAVIE